MRAAVFEGSGILRVAERPDPTIESPNDLIVEVEACGVCGTDLRILATPQTHPATGGVILGHEIVGRVVDVGDGVQNVRPGDRVVVDPDVKCNRCSSCRRGRPADCRAVESLGVHRDGGLARFIRVPEHTVYGISESVPAAIATLAEPLACVFNGTTKASAKPGDAVVVLGGGTIGCLFAAVFSASGATPVVVVEPSAPRRAVVRAAGATVALAPVQFTEAWPDLLPDGADVVVDAVGCLLGNAIDVAAPGARIVLFGVDTSAGSPISQHLITERSLTVMGSFISHFTWPVAIHFVEQRFTALAPIVTDETDLDGLAPALEALREGLGTKLVVRPR